MEHAETINFEIIKRLKEAKIDFAFPTRSLQLDPVDDDKSKAGKEE